MEKDAVNFYDSGYNCAQAVIKASSKDLGKEDGELIKLSSAIGTGMFLGQTCGAVTASLMSIGLKHGDVEPNRENVRKIYKLTKIFETKFKEKHQSINCKELKTVYKKDCRELVKDAGIILKDIIKMEV